MKDISQSADLTRFFKALSDETRLSIVQMLFGKELCVCEIIDLLQMSQPAVSHHLRILKKAEIIKDRRDGKWIYYSLDEQMLSAYHLAYKQIMGHPTEQLLKDGGRERTDFPLCKQLEDKRQHRK